MVATPLRHIVGMGGGGFSMDDEPLLDDFVLQLARRSPPRLCLVPTASSDSSDFIVQFYRAFNGRAVLNDLTLLGTPQRPRQPPRARDLERFVLEQDILYVSGGSTLTLLALWRAHGLDLILRKAWERGVVLAGISAGLVCWFEAHISSAFGEPQPIYDGLGLLEGSASPHYDVSPGRRAKYASLIQGGMPEGYGVDECAALHFVGTELAEVVSSRPDAYAYRLARGPEGVTETRLPTRYLGAATVAERDGAG